MCFSTTAIGTSSGTGIIGTREGQVYAWELASGSKLEASQDLEGMVVTESSTLQSDTFIHMNRGAMLM